MTRLAHLALAFSLVLPAAGQDLQQLIGEQIGQAGELPLEALWSRAAQLRDAARELGSDELDAALDRELGRAREAGPGAVLLIASARLLGEEPDAVSLADALEPLLGQGDEARARAAAALLSRSTFRALADERRQALLDGLGRVAEDGALAPSLRLEAAHSWFQIGWGNERRRARAVMGAFLASGDAELRSQGALALARTGAELVGPLGDELRNLSAVPDERGRLAASYLALADERRDAERRLQRLAEALADQPAGADSQDDLETLRQVLAMVESYHLEGDRVERADLLEAAMDGLLRSLDEHSSYMAPDNYARFEQELEAGYGGIGAYVGEDREDGLFTITRPIFSGPAYKAGVLSDDKIVRVDDWSTLGHPADEVIKRLKGRPGTEVKLYVWRRGMDLALIDRPTEEMAVVIRRDSITIPSVQHQLLPGRVGMVSLRDFSRVATEELRAPLEGMLQQGMRAVVLDLRNNSGGLLDQAVAVAGLFLPADTPVVSTESRVQPKETLSTPRRHKPLIPPDMPVIVLVNRFSASAAEIVSGALQDHGRAVVLGKRTFGKGSVQNLLPVGNLRDDRYEDENQNGRHDNWERITHDFNGNGEFDFAPRVKMTIARYRLPSGRSIHREVDHDGNELSKGGVEPDVDVDARRFEAWRYEELNRLVQARVARGYLDDLSRQFAEKPDWLRERLFQIADNDRKDIALYPGFEDFYLGLETPLSRDDVRQLVRAEVRRRVQDARGQEFPDGDFVEDVQLQEAIRLALDKLGDAPGNYEDYAAIPSVVVDAQRLAALGKDQLAEALALIEAARRGEVTLSGEELERLAGLLEKPRSEGEKR
jgi:carboxyl-terminal processing protease